MASDEFMVKVPVFKSTLKCFGLDGNEQVLTMGCWLPVSPMPTVKLMRFGAEPRSMCWLMCSGLLPLCLDPEDEAAMATVRCSCTVEFHWN